jgi:hypothetical protein
VACFGEGGAAGADHLIGCRERSSAVTNTTSQPSACNRLIMRRQERWSEGDRLGGVGEQGADVGEELGPLLAVYYAVVHRQR